MMTFCGRTKNPIGTLAFASLAFLAPIKAQIPGAVDQSQPDTTGSASTIIGFDISANDFFEPNGQSLAQTFTVGTSGQLTGIDVGLFKDPDFVDNVDFFLLPVDANGVPDENNAHALITGSLTPAQVVGLPVEGVTTTGGLTPILFSTPLAVTAGEHLALELAATGGDEGGGFPDFDSWATSATGNPYAGGAAFLRGSTSTVVPDGATWDPTLNGDQPVQSDFAFTTFVVAAPEPCVTGVAAAAMTLLALRQIRRRRAQI